MQEPASPTSPAHLAVDCEFYKKKPGTGTGKIWKCIEDYRSLIKILSSSHSDLWRTVCSSVRWHFGWLWAVVWSASDSWPNSRHFLLPGRTSWWKRTRTCESFNLGFGWRIRVVLYIVSSFTNIWLCDGLSKILGTPKSNIPGQTHIQKSELEPLAVGMCKKQRGMVAGG